MNEPISIVIPIYNEKDSIIKTVNDICECICDADFAFELILVDDGCTDGSREIIAQIALPHVKKIVHSQTRGYGAALKSGIRTAKNNIIVITDADGTYPNKRIPELLKEIRNHEMVVGARRGQESKIPLMRKFAKWFITKLANYLAGFQIPDLNSGLRVMKKDAVEKFIRLLPDGFSFTATITLAMLTNGYSVKYVPIDYFNREGKSKIDPIKDTINFIQLIARTALYFNPSKIFIPLGLLLVIFAFFVLLGSWLLLGCK